MDENVKGCNQKPPPKWINMTPDTLADQTLGVIFKKKLLLLLVDSLKKKSSVHVGSQTDDTVTTPAVTDGNNNAESAESSGNGKSFEDGTQEIIVGIDGTGDMTSVDGTKDTGPYPFEMDMCLVIPQESHIHTVIYKTKKVNDWTGRFEIEFDKRLNAFSLGINKNILEWVPKMTLKDIMCILGEVIVANRGTTLTVQNFVPAVVADLGVVMKHTPLCMEAHVNDTPMIESARDPVESS